MGVAYTMSTANQRNRRRRTALPPELLAGTTMLLRPITEADLPVLQVWDEDPAIVALMGHKFETRSAGEWLADLRTERNCLAWAIEDRDGNLIGELELAQVNRRVGSAELRICIGESGRQNRGYGTDAIRTALRLAFEGLGLNLVYLRVFLSNARAIHVYQRLGFRKEALLQPSARRHDPAPVLLMNLTRERWNGLMNRSVG